MRHISHNRGRRLLRHIPLFIALLGLSACSWGEAMKPGEAPPIAAVKKEPSSPRPMETFRALAPPTGMSFTPLFNEPIRNQHLRMQRLEKEVQALRNDLDTIVPELARMMQEQKRIPGGDAARGTEPAAAVTASVGPSAFLPVAPEAVPKGMPPVGTASSSSTAPIDIKPQPSVPQPVAAAPVIVPPPPAETKVAAAPENKPEAIVPPAAPVLGEVSAIRIADYPDKTRMVLDMSAKSPGAIKLENGGKTLVVDLSQMKWLGKPSWDADSAQLISGYRMDKDSLYVDLMYASQIKTNTILIPNADNRNYRLMVDLFSPEVHK